MAVTSCPPPAASGCPFSDCTSHKPGPRCGCQSLCVGRRDRGVGACRSQTGCLCVSQQLGSTCRPRCSDSLGRRNHAPTPVRSTRGLSVPAACCGSREPGRPSCTSCRTSRGTGTCPRPRAGIVHSRARADARDRHLPTEQRGDQRPTGSTSAAPNQCEPRRRPSQRSDYRCRPETTSRSPPGHRGTRPTPEQPADASYGSARTGHHPGRTATELPFGADNIKRKRG